MELLPISTKISAAKFREGAFSERSKGETAATVSLPPICFNASTEASCTVFS